MSPYIPDHFISANTFVAEHNYSTVSFMLLLQTKLSKVYRNINHYNVRICQAVAHVYQRSLPKGERKKIPYAPQSIAQKMLVHNQTRANLDRKVQCINKDIYIYSLSYILSVLNFVYQKTCNFNSSNNQFFAKEQ